MPTALKPFETRKLDDGTEQRFFRTDAGRVIRWTLPGPEPHAARLEVFEQCSGRPKCVCCVDSDLRVLTTLTRGWIGGN